MCGICGLYSSHPYDYLDQSVRHMVRTIGHRGPDAEGTFVGDGVALGHRRLSIIDLSPTGAQPMSLGAVTVVYNGESYNFLELRRLLESDGRVFRGHSDTEVLLHAYDAWGLDGLARLEGMFAFALWDAARRRLVLMRDRLGIKPLFYAWHDGHLAFGSEIKAVLAAEEVDRRVDDQAFVEFLWYGNAFEDRTIYRGVRALLPGHRLVVEDGRMRIDAWWRIEEWLTRAPQITNAHEAAAAVREAVDTAVTRQLVGDVPVGIFLSGGIDSSSIAASAALAGGRRLASYAVGFDYDQGINELPKARKVAEMLGLDHNELRVSGASIGKVIVDLVCAHDEPFGDAANIPLYLLAQALGGAVKVVLQGDGGDEMFAGYRRYAILRHARAWRWWPAGVNSLLHSVGGAVGARLARLGAAAGSADPALRMALLLTVETLHDPPTAMLSQEARRRLAASTDPFLAYRRCASRFDVPDPVQQMLLTDITLQLPSQFLPKVDRATMAHGLEARVPLLDERVASLAVGLPSHFKVRGAQKKIVLRDAMRGRLPAEILDGPKIGFGVPFEHWLKGPLQGLARDAILDGGFIERFGFDRGRLAVALDQHCAGVRERGFLLWKLFQLSLWSREYLR
jgi:asparagine synthase (glutamine-hydrolysing)